jgi:hypothetical protein
MAVRRRWEQACLLLRASDPPPDGRARFARGQQRRSRQAKGPRPIPMAKSVRLRRTSAKSICQDMGSTVTDRSITSTFEFLLSRVNSRSKPAPRGQDLLIGRPSTPPQEDGAS